MHLIPVILAGGSGTRLWPLSRSACPKQFMAFLGEQTLFQRTLARFVHFPKVMAPLVVCHEEHRFLAKEQAAFLPETPTFLLEPMPKNTAPAMALAACWLKRTQEEALLLCASADHLIQPIAAFQATLLKACDYATSDSGVIFGVTPTYPETGYGYVQRGELLGDAFQVASFQEKPDLKMAEAYCASGQYYWNSGMFLFRLSTLLKAFETYAPDILTAAENAIALSQQENCFVRPNREAFQQSPENSIDYALLEKLPKTTVIPLQAEWCDVGSWPAVAEQHIPDGVGNTIVGDVVLQNTTRTFVQATHRLVTTIGVDNLIIIETQDSVLILNKEQAGQLKTLIQALKTNHAAVLNTHSRVVRPWGAFESVTAGPRFQVKRITVNVGSKLSLQKHHHRSEHWVVVRGSAKVTRNQEEFLVTENESTYIPIGAVHRLENVGKIPLEIIEVQSGSYLGEDDIVRLEDVYGRMVGV